MLWPSQRYSYWESLKILFSWTMLLVVIEAVDQLFYGNTLYVLGVQQGDFAHWYRIFFAPFLHDDFGHVFGNVLGVMVLGSIVLSLGVRTLVAVTAFAIVASGLGVLLLGSAGIHAGASSIVYGYFGFLVFRGISERSWAAVGISVLVLLAFHGLLAGLLPGRPGTSWHSHVFGALGGVMAAGALAGSRKKIPSGGSRGPLPARASRSRRARS